jgi:hypothetical protein
MLVDYFAPPCSLVGGLKGRITVLEFLENKKILASGGIRTRDLAVCSLLSYTNYTIAGPCVTQDVSKILDKIQERCLHFKRKLSSYDGFPSRCVSIIKYLFDLFNYQS